MSRRFLLWAGSTCQETMHGSCTDASAPADSGTTGDRRPAATGCGRGMNTAGGRKRRTHPGNEW